MANTNCSIINYGEGILCMKRPILGNRFLLPEVLDYYAKGEEGFDYLDKLLQENC